VAYLFHKSYSNGEAKLWIPALTPDSKYLTSKQIHIFHPQESTLWPEFLEVITTNTLKDGNFLSHVLCYSWLHWTLFKKKNAHTDFTNSVFPFQT